MAEAIILLIRIFFLLSLLFLCVGFIRPVYVLWFLDQSNRLKVLQLYGTLAGIFFVLYNVLSHIFISN